MTKTHKRILWSIVAALLLGAAALFALGKQLVEAQLQRTLAQNGLENVRFSVSGLGFKGIVFSDISLGEASPFTLDSLTLDYSILELLQKQVRDVRIDTVVFKKDKIKTEAKNILLHFETPQDGNSWQGDWSVASVQAENLPLPLPLLAGAGTFAVQGKKIDAKGEFKSADATHKAVFDLTYDSAHVESSLLTVNAATFPWNGGVISTRRAEIPLSANRSSTVALQVSNVPLNVLLQTATGNHATATGVVSGLVPLTIGKDGTLTFHAGNLHALAPGTIILAPDAIPGDNQQVAIVRNVLSNFHYRELAMGLDSGKDDKLSMLLQLSGNNPDVYNGREIKLNVRLSGDVLNLLQQTVIPLADPKKFLEQTNAK